MTLFEAGYYFVLFGLPALAATLLVHVVYLFVKRKRRWWVVALYGTAGLLTLLFAFGLGVVKLAFSDANTSEDTGLSRGAFERHFPELESSRFTAVRYYGGGGWEDSYSFFRLRYESFDDLMQIVSMHRLPEVERGSQKIGRHFTPSWCAGEKGVDYRVFYMYWGGEGGATTLWVDEENKIAYFESFTT